MQRPLWRLVNGVLGAFQWFALVVAVCFLTAAIIGQDDPDTDADNGFREFSVYVGIIGLGVFFVVLCIRQGWKRVRNGGSHSVVTTDQSDLGN
jgi:hypothetical protein